MTENTPHQNPFNTRTTARTGQDGLPEPGSALMSGNLAKSYVGQLTLLYTGKKKPVDMGHIEVTCEVYSVGDGTEEQLMIHTQCVACGGGLSIKSTDKKVSWDRGKLGQDGVFYGGKLFIEPFRCSWENTKDRAEFGVNLCRHRMAYDGGVIKDA